ncbi:MAG TPA: hypothetical protein VHM31_01435 [Polyangia bacterium]|nr:hypothetical protein [Polyangia bacterium]
MDASIRPRAWLRASEPVVILACAFGLILVFSRSFLIQSDEGYTLNAAWQVWTGLRMYDDFRLFVGPGSAYAVEAAWRIVGAPSFLAARWASVALAFVGSAGLYLLLRRLAVRGVSLATGMLLWLSLSSLYVLLNHNSFSSFAAIWFVLAVVRVVQGRARGSGQSRDEVLVGVAAGVVFWFLAIKGSLLAFTGAAYLGATAAPGRRARSIWLVAAGFAATVAPLFLIWNPVTLVRQWLIIPITGNYLGHTSASGVYRWAALALVAGMAVTALRLRDRVLQALTCVQAALFAAMLHNMEASHFAINAFPAIVFGVFILHDRVVRPRGAAGIQLPAALVMAMTLAFLLVWTGMTADGAAYGEVSVLQADLLGKRPKPIIKPRVAQAHAIYAGPFLPGLYYLLGKKNPFFVSETVVCDEACQRRLVTQLENLKPEIAFVDYEMISKLHYTQEGPVDAYLREHYVPCPADGIPVRAVDPSWCP